MHKSSKQRNKHHVQKYKIRQVKVGGRSEYRLSASCLADGEGSYCCPAQQKM
jgi:hypothetical protein